MTQLGIAQLEKQGQSSGEDTVWASWSSELWQVEERSRAARGRPTGTSAWSDGLVRSGQALTWNFNKRPQCKQFTSESRMTKHCLDRTQADRSRLVQSMKTKPGEWLTQGIHCPPQERRTSVWDRRYRWTLPLILCMKGFQHLEDFSMKTIFV